MAIFADTHCHLDLYQNMLFVARECEKRAIRTIAVTNLPSTWEAISRQLSEYQYIRVALGFHPQLVGERSHELSLFLRLLAKTRYVGEVGLDGSKEVAISLPQQKRVFEIILRACAEYKGKILTVHSRGAVKDVLGLIDELLIGKGNGVILHWFTGSSKQMLEAVRLGCYFSVNPQMTKSQAGFKLISCIPPDRILTETDGPFVRFGRAPANPWHVVDVVTSLASIWKISPQQASEQVAENFKTLLKSVPINVC